MKFASRMDRIKASEIRELLKLTQRPEIISFAGGLPAPELFPIKAMQKALNDTMEKQGAQALQYGPTEGYDPLRKQIVELMKSTEIEAKYEDILVTNGSQQGLDFSGRVFLNEGDYVITESPSYLGALSAFKAYECNFLDVETDDDGMKMDKLEATIKAHGDRVKMIYVIPDFQNPSGKTWSLERRKQLLEIAKKYDLPIVEDNPYGMLRFEGKILPSIYSMDTDGRVIFLGTFSKILIPGFRLGWVCASPEILQKFILCKQGADLQAGTINQIAASNLMDEFDIYEHVENLKVVYKKRRDAMLAAMDTYFPEGVTYTRPAGGLFTWVVVPETIDTKALGMKAIENLVAFVPGGSFFPNGGNERCMRMNYSMMNEEKIEEGIKRLGELIKNEL
ncbi:PLP-dependent aminotransferase family protein [Gottschalkiaceae bacterium SANA]|nr:PLP-dependent aminotransferase family protein [Gottschalkiaceae bacterium SANA]